jgi:hypothetical protein
MLTEIEVVYEKLRMHVNAMPTVYLHQQHKVGDCSDQLLQLSMLHERILILP